LTPVLLTPALAASQTADHPRQRLPPCKDLTERRDRFANRKENHGTRLRTLPSHKDSGQSRAMRVPPNPSWSRDVANSALPRSRLRRTSSRARCAPGEDVAARAMSEPTVLSLYHECTAISFTIRKGWVAAVRGWPQTCWRSGRFLSHPRLPAAQRDRPRSGVMEILSGRRPGNGHAAVRSADVWKD